jgi:hypothetical protein
MSNDSTPRYEYEIVQASASDWHAHTSGRPDQYIVIRDMAAKGWRLAAVGNSDNASAGTFYLYFERPVFGGDE